VGIRIEASVGIHQLTNACLFDLFPQHYISFKSTLLKYTMIVTNIILLPGSHFREEVKAHKI